MTSIDIVKTYENFGLNIANDPLVESIVYTHVANILYSLLMLETGYVNGLMEKQENIDYEAKKSSSLNHLILLKCN